MPLDTRLSLQAIARLTKTVGLAVAESPLNFTRGIGLDSGVGPNQADLVWHSAARVLAASAFEDLDLAGSLSDPFGVAPMTFARVKAIIVAAAAGNVNNVVLGGAAANAFVGPFGAAAHTAAVGPGGWQAFVKPDGTGWPVTVGTGDLLRVTNSGAGTSVTYDILIIGASA